MRARFVFGTCVGALLSMSVSSQSIASSLENELSDMLLNHPQLSAAQKTTESADKNIDVLSSANLPTVSLNSDYGYEWITNPTERAAVDQKFSSSMMRQVVGVTMTQNLFDGNATDSSVRAAVHEKGESLAAEEVIRQNLIFEGITAYLNVLKEARRISYARENEANIKRQMELEDERVRRGSGIGIDVLNAKSRLQSAKDKRVEYQGQLARASDQYNQVFNRMPDLAAMIDPEPPLDNLPEDLASAVKLARSNNPNVRNAEHASEKALENKRTVQAEYLPTVDLVGSYNYERDKNATAGTRRDYSVLVEANWDLFTGFSTRHSVKKAMFDYASSKDTVKYVGRKTEESTAIAWHTLETAQERLELMENDVILKEEIFLSTRKQRESGAEGVDVLNVLDREKEVYEAKIKYSELFYDTRLAIYSVLLATGRLTPEVLDLN